eukprot:2448852-Rhodomonas_salina.2
MAYHAYKAETRTWKTFPNAPLAPPYAGQVEGYAQAGSRCEEWQADTRRRYVRIGRRICVGDA